MGGTGWFCWTLAWVLLMAGVCTGDGGQQAAGAGPVVAGPPVAEVRPLPETFYGNKIVDKYKWLEDSASPETRKWVAEEMAYTRSVLDPLPGREADSCAAYGTAAHWRYWRAEDWREILFLHAAGWVCRISRCFMCETGLNGKDRVLVDVNLLAADGTVALDWFWPAEHGKICCLRDFFRRVGDEHAAHRRDQDWKIACRIRLSARVLAALRGRSTTPGFITRGIRRRAMFRRDRSDITGMCFITNWELIRSAMS